MNRRCIRVLTAGPGLVLAVLAAVLWSQSASAVVFIEAGGVVSGEGELFSSRTTVTGANWLVVPDEGMGDTITNARGGRYIQNLPDGVGGGGGPLNDPTVSYDLQINTPGQYQLYLRWEGNSNNFGASDSIFADIVELKDGAGGSIPDWYEFGQPLDGNFATNAWDGQAGFEQNVAGPANNPAVFDITAPGNYTLRVSRREDGAAVDAFALQLASLPAPGGFGPTPLVDRGPLVAEAAALTPDADSFIRLGQAGTNFGSDPNILVKDSGSSSTTRKGYIRFDVSQVDLASLVDAELELEVSINNQGGGSSDPQAFTVNVFGLNDGVAGEAWDESMINWDNAPGNDSNNSIDSSATTFLGQFGVPALNPDLEDDAIFVRFNDLISAQPDALLDFLQSDTDGMVSFILTRAGGGGGPNLGFASSENLNMLPPTLRLFNAVPEPTTGVLAMLGISLLAARRRRVA